MPEPILNALHDECMELLGFERAFGQKCFGELGASESFNSDRDVAISVARCVYDIHTYMYYAARMSTRTP